ncbi:MAG: MBL fold metallo-hydrolase, partial [Chloroflexota bacterium]
TGMGVGNFRELVAEIAVQRPIVIQSHAHWDHIGASWQFDDVFIHQAEADSLRAGFPNREMRRWFGPDHLLHGENLPETFDIETIEIPGTEPSGTLDHGEVIDLGGRLLNILYTPGHSPGGITVFDRESGIIFPGDAVNYGPIYLEDDDADLRAYIETLEMLASCAPSVGSVFPSHYDVPMSPGDLNDASRALLEIVNSKVPDRVTKDAELFRRGRFEFVLAPGAIDSLRT